MTNFFQILALLWVKNDNFFANFLAKIFKNHNIGRRYSIKNCLYEAVLQNIISNCSCMPSFVKKNPKKIKICTGLDQVPILPTKSYKYRFTYVCNYKYVFVTCTVYVYFCYF
jgi:hypothetical protein